MCASDPVVTYNTLLRLFTNATILHCSTRAIPALKSMWNVTRESMGLDAIGYDLMLNATMRRLPLFLHPLTSSRVLFVHNQLMQFAGCSRSRHKKPFFFGWGSILMFMAGEKKMWNATLYKFLQFKIHKFFVFIFVFSLSFCQNANDTL